MSIQKIILTLIMAWGMAYGLSVHNVNAQTSELTPGTYRCSSFNVSGAGGSCDNMPPLVLNSDGGYRYSSTRGHWSVSNNKLILSSSQLWGPGKILGRDMVRFEYDYRGLRQTVTWTCRDCVDTEPQNASGAIAHGSYVGVSLVLEFGTEMGGVSGFTIVPAESAVSYTHNAPLPSGSVQGLARETSRTAVTLATSVNNKLLSGRKYVVFLVWPRETIAVAVLDLPPVAVDYTATLPATIDSASILGKAIK